MAIHHSKSSDNPGTGNGRQRTLFPVSTDLVAIHSARQESINPLPDNYQTPANMRQLSTYGTPSETYAIVTGASDGLGKEYALQLARAGFHTLLISRTQSKLDSVATEIKSKYPDRVVSTFAIDFASAQSSDYSKLKSVIDGISSEIGILINNVGLSHSIPVTFAETSPNELEGIINVNCLATLKATQFVLPHLIKRKKGLILTMGSFGGLLPTPLLATYSGSKAFLQQWSTALGAEVAPHGITVELVQSYLITTAMSKIRRASLFVPSPRTYVRSVLSKVGRTGGAQGFSYTSTPYWSHAIMQWVMLALPSGPLLTYNRWMHEGIRKRALKKQSRAKESKKSE